MAFANDHTHLFNGECDSILTKPRFETPFFHYLEAIKQVRFLLIGAKPKLGNWMDVALLDGLLAKVGPLGVQIWQCPFFFHVDFCTVVSTNRKGSEKNRGGVRNH